MKTSMVKILATLVCVLLSVTLSAQNQKKSVDVNKIVGHWIYAAPDAPYGYQDGKIEFKQEKGKLVAKVNIQGNVLTVSNIKVTDNKYTASFYLDGADVNLTMVQNNCKLKGEAHAEGMNIAVTFERLKK